MINDKGKAFHGLWHASSRSPFQISFSFIPIALLNLNVVIVCQAVKHLLWGQKHCSESYWRIIFDSCDPLQVQLVDSLADVSASAHDYMIEIDHPSMVILSSEIAHDALWIEIANNKPKVHMAVSDRRKDSSDDIDQLVFLEVDLGADMVH